MTRDHRPAVIAIVGPTASGKSAFAVQIAKKFKGEVVSADSRQVYRGLDIGTGKIRKCEMKGIPHHLIDIRNPREQYSAAEFKEDAEKKIKEIFLRGNIPVVAGGTGFWIDSLLFGLSIPEIPPNPALRKKLEKKPVEELFGILKKLDPNRARSIDKKNPRRIIRAIEIAQRLGRVPPIKKKSAYRVLWIGTKQNKHILLQRIHTRLLTRARNGLFEEGKKLRNRGLPWKRFYELGLEYRYIADVLQKKQSKKNALQELERAIGHYARRQLVWFKRNKGIHWVKNNREAERLVRTFLTNSPALQGRFRSTGTV